MKRLAVESWFLLLYFDCLLHLGSFRRAYSAVRAAELGTRPVPKVASAELCRAVDLACVFYFKRVQCLQRSAATAVLLRRHGWKAELVIGAQMMPFHSHAWVEIDCQVVNDKPYMAEMFVVLERC